MGRLYSMNGSWAALGVAAILLGAEALLGSSGSRAKRGREGRASLPQYDFAYPAQRRYPINDLEHGRLALTYVMAPSNQADRYHVMLRVFQRYPQLAAWWNSTEKGSQMPVSKAAFQADLDRVSRRLRGGLARRSPTLRSQLEHEASKLSALIRLIPVLHRATA
jgi:hypothetical protein